jgi:hypothetical protein
VIRTLHVDTGREMQGGQWQVLYLVERLKEARLQARAGSLLHDEAVRRGLNVTRDASYDIDLIHAHDARAHSKYAFSRRKPLVVSRRVGFPVGRSIFSRLKYRFADRYLAASKYVAMQLREAGVPDAKIRVVYDGRVVAVASKYKEIGIPVHLTNNLFDDLQTASVFLYVSDMEGLGSAAIAAMAAGVPVVASGVGGLPEVVQHGHTGLIVRDGDYATAVRRLLDNPNLAVELGAAGREKAMREFSVEKMVETTLCAYNEILR